MGKSLCVEHFLRSLPDKRFKTVLISHSSVTGTDLLRLLCVELGRTPRMRRGDNLQEIRLLNCDRRHGQLPFSLLLVGDSQLLPRLQMGINAALLTRLGFCFALNPWHAEEVRGYIECRLEEAGIHSNPFEEAALNLLIQAANGLPRAVNHLAQRAVEAAATQNSRLVTTAHIQRAIELLPWIAKL